MSVILDALRKLDREKLSRRRGTANIAAEIVRPDLAHPGRRIPIYVATVVVAAIAAAAITYGVMAKFGFISKSSRLTTGAVPVPSQQASTASPQSAVASKLSPSAPASPPAASKQIPPAPSESTVSSKILPPAPAEPSAANQQAPPASIPPVSVRDAQQEMSRVPPKVESPTEKKDRPDVKIPVETKSPATPVVEKKTGQDVLPKQVGVSPKKITEPTPNITAANPASLKLSAIVWFEDSSRRFAMINGIMATEGSSVEGMKVVEINPTSVRLLHDGQYFEISMSK